MDSVTSVGCSKALKKKKNYYKFFSCVLFDEIARLSLDEWGII